MSQNFKIIMFIHLPPVFRYTFNGRKDTWTAISRIINYNLVHL